MLTILVAKQFTREILRGIVSNKSTRKPNVDDSLRCMDMMEYCKGY